MSGLVTCAGADVLSGRIGGLGLGGTWRARLRLDTATVPAGAVTIAAAGGLTLQGTIEEAGAHLDVVEAVVIGGANGLEREAFASFRSAQLRDPLAVILDTAGEVQANIDSALLAVRIEAFTLAGSARQALGQLAALAALAIGRDVGWRINAAGEVWIGEETWPAAKLPAGAEVLDRRPGERLAIIGAETPALLPGVDLDGVGRVRAVVHDIQPRRVRTWAWT